MRPINLCRLKVGDKVVLLPWCYLDGTPTVIGSRDWHTQVRVESVYKDVYRDSVEAYIMYNEWYRWPARCTRKVEE